ncbi:MAG: response regulator transcription factor [Arcobacteraceae bacterium]|jgi:DNA-binding response OmpR family regulator|nr:response regulator transcription factor [Arcobacteraceae bacterium]
MDNLSILKNKKVLYVEDDAVIRESISKVLGIFFDNITLASDGQIAMDLLHNSYDIVILDLNLPKYNGLEIAKEVRKKSEETLIFLISSYQETQNLRDAMRLGAIDYLPKPIRFDELKNVLAECANKLSKNEMKSFGENLLYNTRLKSVFKEDEEIKLTKNEITFLELILSNQKQLICYDIITQELFQSQNSDVNLASIKNMILRMRKKLDTQLVESVAGVGYRVL